MDDYVDDFAPIPTPALMGGGRRVYVGNLPFSVRWQDLKDHMKQAGDVEHANVLEVGGRSKVVNTMKRRFPVATTSDACADGLRTGMGDCVVHK